MACRIFGAIDVGSYEVNLKIYELSARNGIRVLNHVRHRMELGRDTYATGKISTELTDELCAVLLDFKQMMKEFGVEDYRACATSAIRETRNTLVFLDRIFLRTGIRLEILSNSEQRFLGYKSIASNEEKFQDIIEQGTAIVDVGGGSIQISLFDKENLVTTQNIRLGTLRLRERLTDVAERTVHYTAVMEELLNNELRTYRKLFLKDRNIQNILLVGSYIQYVNQYIHSSSESSRITRTEFFNFYDDFMNQGSQVMAEKMGISQENSSLLLPTLVMYKRLMDETGAENVIIVGTDLGDGLAYDYAERSQIVKPKHNFENDIIESARNIAKRYHTNKSHAQMMEHLALTIFDKMKSVHGLDRRERLLANVVRFNSSLFMSYEELAAGSLLDREEYLIIAKLTAILRVANALDRSHKQKIKDIKVSMKGGHTMQILVDTAEDLTLEQALFREKAEFFEEVYSIRPVLKAKKLL